jgi:hypothetical protein
LDDFWITLFYSPGRQERPLRFIKKICFAKQITLL